MEYGSFYEATDTLILQVISTGNNSLNNKNLPFPLIRTEAILHMDDDILLSREEIISGFRYTIKTFQHRESNCDFFLVII